MFLNFSISNVRCFQALTEQVDLFGRGRGELVPRVFFFMFCILIGGAYVEIRHGEEVSAQRLILLLYSSFPVHGERGRGEYLTVLAGSR